MVAPAAEKPAEATIDRPSAPTYPDWVNHLPGWLGRMLKKYGWLFGFSNFSMSASLPEPFAIFCNFIIGVGLVLLISGAALAWYLKKKGQEAL